MSYETASAIIVGVVRVVLSALLVWLARWAFDIMTPDMPHWAQVWGSIAFAIWCFQNNGD